MLTDHSSGIGRSVAVLMAREAADISIVYLPQEQSDAEDTKRLVEAEGRTCILIPGDLRDNNFCKRAVEEHIKQYVIPYHVRSGLAYIHTTLAGLHAYNNPKLHANQLTATKLSMSSSTMPPNNTYARISPTLTSTKSKTFSVPTSYR